MSPSKLKSSDRNTSPKSGHQCVDRVDGGKNPSVFPDFPFQRRLTYGSLFSGIGGFDLGFDRAGLSCAWQVEKDEYARRVLAKHWPDVRRWDDVCTFPPEPASDWRCDVLCGGFPCQGISSANHNGQGLADERSGLWREFARTIGVLRPRFAVMENVPALTFRGLDAVLLDLATVGYDAEWDTVSAWQFGAPHQRDRIFIVAVPTGERCETHEIFPRSALETASSQSEARLRMWPGQCERSPALQDRIRWCPDSEFCRMVDGIPDQLDRYRGLGNAVVPQVAEYIGRLIVNSIGGAK